MSVILLASVLSVGPLAMPPVADSEASTNVVLDVRHETLFEMAFRIELAPSVTNNVEIAIGTDSNGNGDLELDEIARIFGRDCGAWFMYDVAANRYEEGVPAEGNAANKTWRFRKSHFAADWDLAKVIRRGAGSVGESVTIARKNEFMNITVR